MSDQILAKDVIRYLRQSDEHIYDAEMVERAIMTVLSQDRSMQEGAALLSELIMCLDAVDQKLGR